MGAGEHAELPRSERVLTGWNVDAVHRELGLCILNDGEIIQITDWYDSDGQKVEDRQAASWCVAGPSADGHWFTVDLSEYDQKPS